MGPRTPVIVATRTGTCSPSPSCSLCLLPVLYRESARAPERQTDRHGSCWHALQAATGALRRRSPPSFLSIAWRSTPHAPAACAIPDYGLLLSAHRPAGLASLSGGEMGSESGRVGVDRGDLGGIFSRDGSWGLDGSSVIFLGDSVENSR